MFYSGRAGALHGVTDFETVDHMIVSNLPAVLVLDVASLDFLKGLANFMH